MKRIIRQPASRRPSRIVRAAPVKEVRVLGIDASLTSTGVCWRNATAIGGVVAYAINPKKLNGPARLAYILGHLETIEHAITPTLVVLEDYAKGIGGGKGKSVGRTFDIGELGGVIKTHFWRRGIDVMVVSPTTVKMVITGRGNADGAKLIGGKKVKDKTKPEMRAALDNTFGIHIDQGDAADACGLMLIGEMRMGSTTVARAQQNRLRLHSLKECVIIQSSQQKT